jgi:hypothetical protein
MSIYETIITTYPELEGVAFTPSFSINLQDDSDGLGAYIAKWEYSKPIPEGLSLGKPNA